MNMKAKAIETVTPSAVAKICCNHWKEVVPCSAILSRRITFPQKADLTYFKRPTITMS
jgi:hypothetical protein